MWWTWNETQAEIIYASCLCKRNKCITPFLVRCQQMLLCNISFMILFVLQGKWQETDKEPSVF